MDRKTENELNNLSNPAKIRYYQIQNVKQMLENFLNQPALFEYIDESQPVITRLEDLVFDIYNNAKNIKMIQRIK